MRELNHNPGSKTGRGYRQRGCPGPKAMYTASRLGDTESSTMKKALILILALFTLPAAAEVLLLDAIAEEPANSSSGLPRPDRGMTMDQVRNSFGNANEEMAAVGEPPISRWIYPDFTVYFEHRWVIDTVVHR